VAYIWHAGTKAGIVQDSLAACGFETRSQIIWAKNNFAIGRGHYHCKHELPVQRHKILWLSIRVPLDLGRSIRGHAGGRQNQYCAVAIRGGRRKRPPTLCIDCKTGSIKGDYANGARTRGDQGRHKIWAPAPAATQPRLNLR
jgi:hypothetical protein